MYTIWDILESYKGHRYEYHLMEGIAMTSDKKQMKVELSPYLV